MIYNAFYVTSGIGESDISEINAFDDALNKAKIADCNLVRVSSILPENPKRLKSLPDLAIGEVIHCVLSRIDGKENDELSAGLGWVIGKRYDGKKFGFVMEAEGHVSKKELEKALFERLDDMACRRNFFIISKECRIAHIDKVNKKFGCCIVTLIYRRI